ncbi:putative ribosome biogenesis protein RLP24 [Echinococcus granulosus]|uniref:Probable ribosome biogenesis protein RLP24 n=1 Tax=Echinococcus granulosus TaxID=6210 RepID=W6UPA5_ECHGR|nr:putative ribosome biogenesis protein RLP24 [Echinococcus granulosus]EUB60107.1 putative ribosome biogenesis protein RLP24 [Echinococcus granulosus]
MRIYRCWFCSSPIYPGHGIMFVRNDCKEFRFCRGKCHKAFKRKRAPRKTKWTKTYRKFAKKDLSDDFAQTFERKRNVIQKYSRENLVTTLNAIKTISHIKEKREKLFLTKRLKKGIELRKKEDVKLVETQMHLIRAPNARESETAESKQEDSVEQMDIEMEDMENKMERESLPSTSKRVVRRRLLVKNWTRLSDGVDSFHGPLTMYRLNLVVPFTPPTQD